MISTTLSKKSWNDLLENMNHCRRLTKNQLSRLFSQEITFIPLDIRPFVSFFSTSWLPLPWMIKCFLRLILTSYGFKIVLRKVLEWFRFRKHFLNPKREVYEISSLAPKFFSDKEENFSHESFKGFYDFWSELAYITALIWIKQIPQKKKKKSWFSGP